MQCLPVKLLTQQAKNNAEDFQENMISNMGTFSNKKNKKMWEFLFARVVEWTHATRQNSRKST